MKKIYLAASVAGALGICGLGILGIKTYSMLNQQQDAISTLASSINEIQNSGGMHQGDLDASVQRSLELMEEREAQDRREQMFHPYRLASNDYSGDQWIYGSPEARFTLVQYADTQCGYCKSFHSTPKGIVDASKGNVQWEYHHHPVLGQRSVAQAQAAECIGEQLGNQAFWVYLDAIFEQSGNGGTGNQFTRRLAADVGADVSEFDSCISSGRHVAEIQAEKEANIDRGITGTPATIVVDNQTGNTQLLGGAQPADAFVQTMRRMMQDES
ncbi:DsbA family protein [Halomonas sp. 86]|uniref:DsbA family protein n=1 Tax=unclassified Halomonas TaxID=2609666 RepID=UPI004033F249